MNATVKVGIFMSAALVVLAYFIFQIEDLRLFGPEATRVEAAFDSVAGLDDKSAVRVAGVRVGRVDGIRLDGQRAIVGLLLEVPVELRDGARAEIANLGMLGDKFVILDPGPPGAPPFPDGALIPGTSPVSFDDALAKLSGIGDSLEKTLSGIGPEEAGASISRLLDNLEAVSADIRSLVAANRGQLDATVGNFERFSGTLADELPRLTDQIERVLAQVEGVVEENRSPLGEGLENLAEITDRMRGSVEDLRSISSKIAAGEGSLGKLVASDEAHDQLVATLGSVESGVADLSEVFGRVKKLQLGLGFESYYLDGLDDFRTAFNVSLDPRSERFYQLAVVDDPRGRTRSKVDTTTVVLPDGSRETTRVENLSVEDKVTISAQVGLAVGAARLRAGLFESTAGAGVDYGLFGERLWITFEAFDFGREPDLDPRVRLVGRWDVHPNAYLLGGLDDFLESDRDSLFLGVGVRWTDDELKYLMGSVPRF